jgi:DNA gyrase subunit A
MSENPESVTSKTTPSNGNIATMTANAGLVRPADIVSEMQEAYLDYAMSVIVARALPDVRDGLKPVHRRILYAVWHDLGLTHDKPHKKSARIVGEVLGKYHPHGDTAVYDAMVRMAQPFSLRYPLIDGQGNFGSIDGDNAAAMRYTEARLAAITHLMLEDLDKETVEWGPHFDNTLREPMVLPAALPNLLINGSSGIAVGMATNIPPHNLGEVVDAAAYMIDHFDNLDEVHTTDLMEFVKGPDFPTGGIVYRFRDDEKGNGKSARNGASGNGASGNGASGEGAAVDETVDVIHQGYSTGRARLIMQAKAHFEEMTRGRMRILITELPYQTNKIALLERIADLVRDGKLEGISDLRDESDRTGMRVVVELKRDVDPKIVLRQLYKLTPLQQTFGMQLLALVDGQPKMLNLKRMLEHFIRHRQEIIRRRSAFDLKRARERLHIVEGLLKALDLLDEVIATIRRSQTVDTARKNLIANFKFSELQAQAILDMQLRRLAALERKKLQEEHDELLKRIAWLESLLASPQKVLALIKSDLLEIKESYGDPRRTQIVDLTRGAHTTHDLLPEQDVWVSVGSDGTLRRTDAGRLTQTSLRQVAKGAESALFQANARDLLYLFADSGRAARLGVHELQADNKPASEFTGLERKERATAALALPRSAGPAGPGSVESGSAAAVDVSGGYLFLTTERAGVKRVSLENVTESVNSGSIVMNLDDKDRLGWALRTDGSNELLLVSSAGQAIRFAEEEVRSMGLPAGGVGGMKLGKNEKIVFAGVVEPNALLLTYTEKGFAKLTALADFPRQGRNGGGVTAHKLSARTGGLTAAAILPADRLPKLLALVTPKATPRVIELSEIPNQGRASQGKQVVDAAAGVPVAAIRWLESSEVVEPPAPRTAAPRLIEEEPKAVQAASKAAVTAKHAPKASNSTPPRTSKATVPIKQAPAGKAAADKSTANKAAPAKRAASEAASKTAPRMAKAGSPQLPPAKATAKPAAAAASKRAPKPAKPAEQSAPAEQAGLFGESDLPPTLPDTKGAKNVKGKAPNSAKLKTVTSVKK